jgi:hypothetical protein
MTPSEVAMTQPTSQIKRALIGMAIVAANNTERDAREHGETHLEKAAIDRQDELFQQWRQAEP